MLEGDRDQGFLDIACYTLFARLQSMAFAVFVSIYKKKPPKRLKANSSLQFTCKY